LVRLIEIASVSHNFIGSFHLRLQESVSSVPAAEDIAFTEFWRNAEIDFVKKRLEKLAEELVTESVHCDDVLRKSGILFELLTEPGNVRVYGAGGGH
jgi:hypothetical protein